MPRMPRSDAPPNAMDLFWRRVLQAERAAGRRSAARVRQRPHPDLRLGNDGPRAAVKSAGPFRAGAGQQAGAVLRSRADRRTVAATGEHHRLKRWRSALFDNAIAADRNDRAERLLSSV